MNLPIEIREVIVCDEIRKEDNGKAIIIGVYSGDILVNIFPISLRLAFWLQGRPHESSNREMELKIEVTDQDVPISIIGKAHVGPIADGTQSASLTLASVQIVIQKPGALVVSARDGDSWIELVRKKIALMEIISAANVSPQFP